MDSLNIPAQTHREFLKHQKHIFYEVFKSGGYQPVIFPRDFASFFILFAALLIKWPRHGVFKFARHFLFCCILYLNILNISQIRMRVIAGGYCVGLMSFWFILWSAVLLVFTDVQRSFSRIERSFESEKLDEVDDRSSTNGAKPAVSGRDVLLRATARSRPNGRSSTHRVPPKDTSEEQPQLLIRYKWQKYPDQFAHRLTWAFDLIFNFRGPNWNWGIPLNLSIPKAVLPQLDQQTSQKSENLSWDEEPKVRFKPVFYNFLVNYLMIDVLKVVLMNDPYFWGITDSPPPFFIAYYFGGAASILTVVYRIVASILGISSALGLINSTVTAINIGVAAIPGLLKKTALPIEAPWLYPELFGNLITSSLDGGIAGLWGSWWHQLFRFGFLTTGSWVSSLVPASIRKRPLVTWALRIMRLFIAFVLSGLMHATGSYTQLVTTNPFHGQLTFFILQPVGILLQILTGNLFLALLPFDPPRWVRRTANLIFAVCWELRFSPLLADDFAKGGLWLLEPIPISPLRGLGLGAEGDGWWCWGEELFRGWKGQKWWERGIQIL